MTSKPVFKDPGSVEALARLWAAIPFGLVIAWYEAGHYPTLAEYLTELEELRAGEP